ncbi:uncharacterized protein MONOS_761 [Monocercomonoides exilis]|uniref:uncharacterized protein n=1 Tax=Monocercomonoides exilis TaxID=2049356 RepID=UPI00355A130D|nr:hypothetical protein MONOS_761 [Monocercomonoides exilis]|eukprot:MONOS_761.1-p1 / transcript=MONOS_761.1 / gene=MONOS_761 / organism=Monocercomonoides_exilis_PA203 / gene_product=unspecified product / transcript_product=unspecified product / location=Mono_scaffold00013:1957-6437(+) / protein_length=1471 / sequence_SO=supercontig / SO=protein_coding / is_pseudo=false
MLNLSGTYSHEISSPYKKMGRHEEEYQIKQILSREDPSHLYVSPSKVSSNAPISKQASEIPKNSLLHALSMSPDPYGTRRAMIDSVAKEIGDVQKKKDSIPIPAPSPRSESFHQRGKTPHGSEANSLYVNANPINDERASYFARSIAASLSSDMNDQHSTDDSADSMKVQAQNDEMEVFSLTVRSPAPTRLSDDLEDEANEEDDETSDLEYPSKKRKRDWQTDSMRVQAADDEDEQFSLTVRTPAGEMFEQEGDKDIIDELLMMTNTNAEKQRKKAKRDKKKKKKAGLAGMEGKTSQKGEKSGAGSEDKEREKEERRARRQKRLKQAGRAMMMEDDIIAEVDETEGTELLDEGTEEEEEEEEEDDEDDEEESEEESVDAEMRKFFSSETPSQSSKTSPLSFASHHLRQSSLDSRNSSNSSNSVNNHNYRNSNGMNANYEHDDDNNDDALNATEPADADNREFPHPLGTKPNHHAYKDGHEASHLPSSSTAATSSSSEMYVTLAPHSAFSIRSHGTHVDSDKHSRSAMGDSSDDSEGVRLSSPTASHPHSHPHHHPNHNHNHPLDSKSSAIDSPNHEHTAYSHSSHLTHSPLPQTEDSLSREGDVAAADDVDDEQQKKIKQRQKQLQQQMHNRRPTVNHNLDHSYSSHTQGSNLDGEFGINGRRNEGEGEREGETNKMIPPASNYEADLMRSAQNKKSLQLNSPLRPTAEIERLISQTNQHVRSPLAYKSNADVHSPVGYSGMNGNEENEREQEKEQQKQQTPLGGQLGTEYASSSPMAYSQSHVLSSSSPSSSSSSSSSSPSTRIESSFVPTTASAESASIYSSSLRGTRELPFSSSPLASSSFPSSSSSTSSSSTDAFSTPLRTSTITSSSSSSSSSSFSSSFRTPFAPASTLLPNRMMSSFSTPLASQFAYSTSTNRHTPPSPFPTPISLTTTTLRSPIKLTESPVALSSPFGKQLLRDVQLSRALREPPSLQAEQSEEEREEILARKEEALRERQMMSAVKAEEERRMWEETRKRKEEGEKEREWQEELEEIRRAVRGGKEEEVKEREEREEEQISKEKEKEKENGMSDAFDRRGENLPMKQTPNRLTAADSKPSAYSSSTSSSSSSSNALSSPMFSPSTSSSSSSSSSSLASPSSSPYSSISHTDSYRHKANMSQLNRLSSLASPISFKTASELPSATTEKTPLNSENHPIISSSSAAAASVSSSYSSPSSSSSSSSSISSSPFHSPSFIYTPDASSALNIRVDAMKSHRENKPNEMKTSPLRRTNEMQRSSNGTSMLDESLKLTENSINFGISSSSSSSPYSSSSFSPRSSFSPSRNLPRTSPKRTSPRTTPKSSPSAFSSSSSSSSSSSPYSSPFSSSSSSSSYSSRHIDTSPTDLHSPQKQEKPIRATRVEMDSPSTAEWNCSPSKRSRNDSNGITSFNNSVNNNSNYHNSRGSSHSPVMGVRVGGGIGMSVGIRGSVGKSSY